MAVVRHRHRQAQHSLAVPYRHRYRDTASHCRVFRRNHCLCRHTDRRLLKYRQHRLPTYCWCRSAFPPSTLLVRSPGARRCWPSTHSVDAAVCATTHLSDRTEIAIIIGSIAVVVFAITHFIDSIYSLFTCSPSIVLTGLYTSGTFSPHRVRMAALRRRYKQKLRSQPCRRTEYRRDTNPHYLNDHHSHYLCHRTLHRRH